MTISYDYKATCTRMPPQDTWDQRLDLRARPEGYYLAVQGYNRRHLKHVSDKLPALSGLAQNVFNSDLASSGRYMAGMWERDFARGILWGNGEHLVGKFVSDNHVSQAEVRTITTLTKINEVYVAPSWSWVAYMGPVEYSRRDNGVVATLAEDVEEDTEEEHRVRSEKWNARVISVDMRLASADPFGQILAGSHITVEGYCQEVCVRNGEKAYLKDRKENVVCYFDTKETAGRVATYLCLQIARRQGLLHGDDSTPADVAAARRLDQLGIRGLLLERSVEIDESWQRVGTVLFQREAESDSGWEKKVLKLI